MLKLFVLEKAKNKKDLQTSQLPTWIQSMNITVHKRFIKILTQLNTLSDVSITPKQVMTVMNSDYMTKEILVSFTVTKLRETKGRIYAKSLTKPRKVLLRYGSTSWCLLCLIHHLKAASLPLRTTSSAFHRTNMQQQQQIDRISIRVLTSSDIIRAGAGWLAGYSRLWGGPWGAQPRGACPNLYPRSINPYLPIVGALWGSPCWNLSLVAFIDFYFHKIMYTVYQQRILPDHPLTLSTKHYIAIFCQK